MKDFRGTDIKVGSVIVYAVKHSTYPSVTEAVVNKIEELHDDNCGSHPPKDGTDHVETQCDCELAGTLTVTPTGRGRVTLLHQLAADPATRIVLIMLVFAACAYAEQRWGR